MDELDTAIPEENGTELPPDEMVPPTEGLEPTDLESEMDPIAVDQLPPSLEVDEFNEFEPEIPAEETFPEEPKPDSKFKIFFRKLLRWTVGVLIVFGLGLITGIFVLYRPASKEADQEIRQGQTDLLDANSLILDYENQVLDLQNQVDNLKALQVKNDELLAAQDGFKLHVAVLDARLDVTSAQLALNQDDTAAARITLDKTATTLNTITSLLNPDQQDVVTAMKQRLDLVMSELENDIFAAQSDLHVLATNLLQLEDALFSE
jgi:hypothetical protein